MTTSSRRLPKPGDVIEYCYLWTNEANAGQQEGSKSRPCLVLAVDEGTSVSVDVLPLTTKQPGPLDGIELPAATARRLELKILPTWIVLTELNHFVWPGPDLRRALTRDQREPFWLYGHVAGALYEFARRKILERLRAGSSLIVSRSE